MGRCRDPAAGKINPKEQRKHGRDLVCARRGSGALSWLGGGLRSEYRIQGPEIAGREQRRVESSKTRKAFRSEAQPRNASRAQLVWRLARRRLNSTSAPESGGCHVRVGLLPAHHYTLTPQP